MSVPSPIKPNHKAIKEYHQTLQEFRDQNVAHEGAVRSAFQHLLTVTDRQHGWTLIPEYIVRLIGQVVQVSVETVRIVRGLPANYSGEAVATTVRSD